MFNIDEIDYSCVVIPYLDYVNPKTKVYWYFYYVLLYTKALRYNFSFGNSLSKRLRNLMKVNKLRLAKIITSSTSFCKFFN